MWKQGALALALELAGLFHEEGATERKQRLSREGLSQAGDRTVESDESNEDVSGARHVGGGTRKHARLPAKWQRAA